MKTVKTLLAAAIAATAISAPAAMAEGIDVSASVAIANLYLWRGQDLSDGSPAVSGDLTASLGGFYTGIWASSGDDSGSQEYDLYAGWGMETDNFWVDVSVWNYVYPNSDAYGAHRVGELSDVIASAGFGPVSVTYIKPITGHNNSYQYLSLGAEFGAFSATLGMTDQDDATTATNDDGDDIPIMDDKGNVKAKNGTDYMHLDLSYAYNDNLSFTVSQVIDDDGEDTNLEADNDMIFVLSYSLPIGD